LWWISLVAFQTRKRPPPIRIRSRQEKACPNRVKERLREGHDDGDRTKQAEAKDQRESDADAAGLRALMLGQLVSKDRDEDEIIDAEHHLHHDQGRQRHQGGLIRN
jgi:hypothetical protein